MYFGPVTEVFVPIERRCLAPSKLTLLLSSDKLLKWNIIQSVKKLLSPTKREEVVGITWNWLEEVF